MKVLIIDDESFDLFVAKKLLGLEFDAHGFTTSEEALAWAKDNDFDVVIIDYYLTTTLTADMVLKQLQALKPGMYKAYVLTNYVDQPQTEQLKSAGFDDVLMKPITLERFKELI